MKQLYLLRHAKSAWDDDSLPDHERTLSPRGQRHAPLMAAHLAEHVPAPDHIYCSDAVRTLETLRPVAKAWKLAAKKTTVTPDLYLATEKKLLHFLRALPDTLDRVLLLGHNPGLTDLVNRLTPKGEYLKNIPSGGFVALDLDIVGWADLTERSASLKARLKPRDLFE
jgi:phosphohistidine phosphatase